MDSTTQRPSTIRSCSRDRKRMAQLLIDDVTLVKNEELHVHIRFKGGAAESLVLPLPENAWRKRLTHPDVVTRIAQLLELYDDDRQAAEQLNAEGFLTGARKPFNIDAVSWVRYSHGLKTRKERLRESGRLTTCEMAGRLGLSVATVRQWVRDGHLTAERHGRKATWLINPIDEQPEEIQQLAARCAQSQAPRSINSTRLHASCGHGLPIPRPLRATRPRPRPAARSARDRRPPRGLGPCGPARAAQRPGRQLAPEPAG